MKFFIREMVPEDWPEVQAIYRQGLETNVATFETQTPSYEEWDASHSPDCRFVIVSQEEGHLAGWAALSPISKRSAYTGVRELSIYIHNHHRGMNLGERLLLYMIELSEAHGVWTLQSSIIEDNLASLRLHDKCGFRQVGTREKIAKNRLGVWRSVVLMERRSTLSIYLGENPQAGAETQHNQ